MKKWLASLLSMILVLFSFTAFAQETTALPYGVNFTMDYDAVLAALGDDAEEDPWEDGCGLLMTLAGPVGIGELKAESANFQVDRNNSEKASRLSQINIVLPTGENCISAFKEALAAITEVYGEPDSDPFDEASVSSYVEYGNLSANWTAEDARIILSMNRMYQENLSLDFVNRLCYRAEDLQ